MVIFDSSHQEQRIRNQVGPNSKVSAARHSHQHSSKPALVSYVSLHDCGWREGEAQQQLGKGKLKGTGQARGRWAITFKPGEGGRGMGRGRERGRGRGRGTRRRRGSRRGRGQVMGQERQGRRADTDQE